MPGKLLLLPNTLSEDGQAHLPVGLNEAIAQLDGLFAETPKVARALLKNYPLKVPLQQFPIETLSEHTQDSELGDLIEPLLRGECWGILSDAGLPCIADPGSRLVSHARRHNVAISALSGPSSIFLILMLSGFSGQRFTFHGYLPRKEMPLADKLKALTLSAQKEGMVHLFIEAPYRNNPLLKTLLATLPPSMELAVGVDLTSAAESVIVQPIAKWRKGAPHDYHKRPAIFAIRAPGSRI